LTKVFDCARLKKISWIRCLSAISPTRYLT